MALGGLFGIRPDEARKLFEELMEKMSELKMAIDRLDGHVVELAKKIGDDKTRNTENRIMLDRLSGDLQALTHQVEQLRKELKGSGTDNSGDH
ncbi:MAG: hypothetical protein QXP58_07005 [Thermoprotei archaeon]